MRERESVGGGGGREKERTLQNSCISEAEQSSLEIHIIRECGSTIYVGMAYQVPPTNTKLRIDFLLTGLWKALFKD